MKVYGPVMRHKILRYLKNKYNISENNLDNNSLSEKPIYKIKDVKTLFFFKRELTKDHYFIGKETSNSKPVLYKLNYNSKNYNPEFTEIGKFNESFKIIFDDNESITELDTLENIIEYNENLIEKGGDKNEIIIKEKNKNDNEIILSIENKLKEVSILIQKLKNN